MKDITGQTLSHRQQRVLRSMFGAHAVPDLSTGPAFSRAKRRGTLTGAFTSRPVTTPSHSGAIHQEVRRLNHISDPTRRETVSGAVISMANAEARAQLSARERNARAMWTTLRNTSPRPAFQLAPSRLPGAGAFMAAAAGANRALSLASVARRAGFSDMRYNHAPPPALAPALG